jgi:PAS domain-containing protein
MAGETHDPPTRPDLRAQALWRLTGQDGPEGAQLTPIAAMKVLHDLASSPESAGDALALLHELQVHQVEIETQAEELRAARAALEAALTRQRQLYDFAPVGYFTIDEGTTLHEGNLTGARLLAMSREALPGRTLESFLTPSSGPALRALLARVAGNGREEGCTLQLLRTAGGPQRVQAWATPDPSDGSRFLVSLIPENT